jgi:hypothetical protein
VSAALVQPGVTGPQTLIERRPLRVCSNISLYVPPAPIHGTRSCAQLHGHVGRSHVPPSAGVRWSTSSSLRSARVSPRTALRRRTLSLAAVYLPYCDGASWAGWKRDITKLHQRGGNAHVHYRGKAILDATIDTLLARGLDRADEVCVCVLELPLFKFRNSDLIEISIS